MHLTTLGALRRLGVPSFKQAVGTTSARFQLGATTGQNMMGTFAETTATSGDTRLRYERLYFSGAGGSGEALRTFATVNNVTAAVGGTVNGNHTTLSVAGASGAVSGAGNAQRLTLSLGASTNAGGTLAALQLDSDFDNAATVPATASCIRVTNSNTKLWANLMTIPAPANGSIFAAHTTQTMTQSIRILGSNGTPYYVMCTDTATNRS